MTDEGIKTTVVYKTETGGPYTYQGDIYFDKDQAPNRPTTAVTQANRPKTAAKTVTEITDVIIEGEQLIVTKYINALQNAVKYNTVSNLEQTTNEIIRLKNLNIKKLIQNINAQIQIEASKPQKTNERLNCLKNIIPLINEILKINKDNNIANQEVAVSSANILMYARFFENIDIFLKNTIIKNTSQICQTISTAKTEYKNKITEEFSKTKVSRQIRGFAGRGSTSNQIKVAPKKKIGGSSTKKRMNNHPTMRTINPTMRTIKRKRKSKRMRSHPYSKRTRAHKSTRLTKRRSHI